MKWGVRTSKLRKNQPARPIADLIREDTTEELLEYWKSMPREGRLSIDRRTVEGIEHILRGISRGDYDFVKVRSVQLVHGIREALGHEEERHETTAGVRRRMIGEGNVDGRS